jgi:hypothetical protein
MKLANAATWQWSRRAPSSSSPKRSLGANAIAPAIAEAPRHKPFSKKRTGEAPRPRLEAAEAERT